MKVRLHFAEKLRIVDWLRANKEDLMRRQDDYEVVADRASRELDLNVTVCGIRGILKDLDMLWFRTGQARGPTGRNDSKYGKRRTRGLGKKTIERLEAEGQDATREALYKRTNGDPKAMAEYDAGLRMRDDEPIKPVEPIAPIVKQGDLFLGDDGTITNGTANRVQDQIDGLRNKVTTMTSRVANAPDQADLVAAMKRIAKTVEAIGARVGDIEDALTKPNSQV